MCMSFYILGELCKRIVICKGFTISCCNEQNNELYFNELINPENIYRFDDYTLMRNSVTSGFCDEEDIGKFITDIDGICTMLNTKTIEMIGETKRITSEPIWSFNLISEDLEGTIAIWKSCSSKETQFIHKERRMLEKGLAHLIVEAHPIFSLDRSRFKGFRGIIIRVPKSLWYKLDTNIMSENFPRIAFSSKHEGNSSE